MEIPRTLPEPLNLLNALYSMKAINQIFRDQLQFYFGFAPIHISSPFRFLDFASFESDVLYNTGTRSKLIRDKLIEINKLARSNIQLYDKIKNKTLEGSQPRYYIIYKELGAIPAANPMAEYFVRHPDNKQAEGFPVLYWFFNFTERVLAFTDACLAEPMEPRKMTEPSPSTDQIGVFFYYLSEGKCIKRPEAKDFRMHEFHKKEPYFFKRSGNTVYNAFLRPKLTKKNVSVVITMLAAYPSALVLAKKDLYSINIDE